MKTILIIAFICTINTSCLSQLVHVFTNSYIQVKAKAVLTENTDAHGSYITPSSTFTHEIFINSAFKVSEKLNVYLGIGTGYFNAAYKINTTRAFLDHESSDSSPYRFSNLVSTYYALRVGLSKKVFFTKGRTLNLSGGARSFIVYPGEGELALGRQTNNMIYTSVTKEKVVKGKNLGFSIDISAALIKRIQQSPETVQLSVSKN